jgi:hypothetical protein
LVGVPHQAANAGRPVIEHPEGAERCIRTRKIGNNPQRIAPRKQHVDNRRQSALNRRGGGDAKAGQAQLLLEQMPKKRSLPPELGPRPLAPLGLHRPAEQGNHGGEHDQRNAQADQQFQNGEALAPSHSR